MCQGEMPQSKYIPWPRVTDIAKLTTAVSFTFIPSVRSVCGVKPSYTKILSNNQHYFLQGSNGE